MRSLNSLLILLHAFTRTSLNEHLFRPHKDTDADHGSSYGYLRVLSQQQQQQQQHVIPHSAMHCNGCFTRSQPFAQPHMLSILYGVCFCLCRKYHILSYRPLLGTTKDLFAHHAVVYACSPDLNDKIEAMASKGPVRPNSSMIRCLDFYMVSAGVCHCLIRIVTGLNSVFCLASCAMMLQHRLQLVVTPLLGWTWGFLNPSLACVFYGAI